VLSGKKVVLSSQKVVVASMKGCAFHQISLVVMCMRSRGNCLIKGIHVLLICSSRLVLTSEVPHPQRLSQQLPMHLRAGL
jgi:hypothetical protein